MEELKEILEDLELRKEDMKLFSKRKKENKRRVKEIVELSEYVVVCIGDCGRLISGRTKDVINCIGSAILDLNENNEIPKEAWYEVIDQVYEQKEENGE